MKMISLSQGTSTVIMCNFIDEAERHAELYGYRSPRQQMLIAVVKQNEGKLQNRGYVNDALRAVNASVTEINWLQRTGYIYLG